LTRKQHKRLALAWLVLVGAVAGSLAWRLPGYRFDSGLLSLLPAQTGEDAQITARLNAVNEHLQQLVDRELIVLVGSPDAQQSRLLATQVRAQLSSEQRKAVSLDGAEFARFARAYYPYRYFLLSPADAQALAGQPATLVRDARNRLYSPLASGYDAHNDPFWLFQNYLQSLAALSPLRLQDGWLTLQSRGVTYRLLRFRLQGDAFSLDTQADLLAKLDEARGQLPVDAVLLTSGLVVHAAHGAQQARREISTVGLGSLIGVLGLLWLALGRWQTLPLLMACVGSGLLVAFSTSLWLFSQLHLVTIAFGVSLIGVGIDYGIHAWMGIASGERMRHLLPALALGLLTSLLAYGVQGAMPFPGLRQMAVFSCVGLVAAWLCVCLWLPLLPRTPGGSHAPRVFALADLWWRRAPAAGFPPAYAGLALMLGLPMLLVAPGDDRLAQLQTSPPRLVAQEQQVQQLLHTPTPGRYFVVSATTESLLDERLAKLTAQLAELKSRGGLGGFSSLHDWRPPLAQQRENRTVLEHFYAGQLDAWFVSLGAPEQSRPAMTALHDADQALDLARWQSAMPQEHLYWRSKQGEHLALVPLQGVVDKQSMLALTGVHCQYVDRVGQIGELLGHYRKQLQQWIVYAVIVVLGMLLWRFGWRALPVLAVPVLAVVLVAGWLAVGPGLTLFHGLALLLVMGIGFDSSVFLLSATGPRTVWHASSLSIATSMISFGLLALSQTPVLHFFGVTVLAGLALVWILLPCAYKGLPQNTSIGEVKP
jgi:predicted exporter